MNRLAATALAIAIACPVAAQDSADTIYFGGPILTMDDAAPRAEAVAAKDGTILAVGALADLSALQGENTETIDLGGRTMLPGFVDAHGHAMMIGLQALSANMLPAPDGEVNDIPALQRVLGEFAEAFPERVAAGNLLLGFGYDDSQLAELRHPTRADLDAVSTDIPVVIIHQSGHIGVLNSKALEVVGFDAQTAERPGGVIRREADGTPNGVLEETPFFEALMGLLGALDENAMRVMFRAGTELLASYGYTTGQDGRSSAGQAQIMQAVATEEGLDIDVVSYPDILMDRDFILANARRDYVDGFRVAGAKLTIDGSPQGFTAFRDRPYYNPPPTFRGDYVGYTAASNDQVFDAIDWAFANDIQILTHSNGEGASDILIAAIRQATEVHGPADRRPVLIHGQFQREDQVQAFVDLGVFPSLFPMHTFYWGDWHRDRTVGPVLAENISPTQWYLTRGSMFSSHHDAPVAFPDSMRILDATVTRRSRSNDIIGPDQRVDVITALKAMTIWPAFQHFEEDRKGSIEVGKLADFVILSDDPTAVDPETLDSLTVMRTIKGDQVVYDVGTVKDGHLIYRPGSGDQGTLSRVLMAGAPWIGQPAPQSMVDVAFRRAMARQPDPHAALHAIDRVMNGILRE
ncbi:amidohydrolase [Palleronia sp. KMU-117]|uniref:amidohydrolase n=1 Tax=Palleronia sp. KMU-117 TaxID=3434108 RepID=UPI003D71E76F